MSNREMDREIFEERFKRELKKKDSLSKKKKNNEELKVKILEAAVALYAKKGVKFILDDIAHELRISKKTIYIVFKDKEDLMISMVDYCFNNIKAAEDEILRDDSIDIVEKLRRILQAMPEEYRAMDIRNLYILADRYPRIYKHVSKRLESDWETTIAIIEQGIVENKIKPIDIPIFKSMLEASIEHFFSSDVLIKNGLTYDKALSEVVNILISGIEVK
ncbi:transcriptional regulator, TetR family [Lachnospiraceae bacterium RM5]|nr:transcriptional regulator, TetR family [Lachnospiraceae bacterium RM5]